MGFQPVSRLASSPIVQSLMWQVSQSSHRIRHGALVWWLMIDWHSTNRSTPCASRAITTSGLFDTSAPVWLMIRHYPLQGASCCQDLTIVIRSFSESPKWISISCNVYKILLLGLFWTWNHDHPLRILWKFYIGCLLRNESNIKLDY